MNFNLSNKGNHLWNDMITVLSANFAQIGATQTECWCKLNHGAQPKINKDMCETDRHKVMQECNKPSATDRNRAWLVQRLWTETNYVKNTTSVSSCNLEQVTLTKPPNQNTCKTINTPAQKLNFSIKDFFSKWDQIRWKLRIWSHLRKKSWMENFIFLCSVPSIACQLLHESGW